MTLKFDKNGLATAAGQVKIFYFNQDNGEYIGSGDEYINIGVSIPGHSTTIDPVATDDKKVSVFNGVKWEQYEDHRGDVVYSVTDRTTSVVDYIGELKPGFVTNAPATPFDEWIGGEWVTDEPAAYESQRQQLIFQISLHINNKQWPGKAAIGRLKGEELEQYGLWLDYLDALEAIDISTAPDIDWPTPPPPSLT